MKLKKTVPLTDEFFWLFGKLFDAARAGAERESERLAGRSKLPDQSQTHSSMVHILISLDISLGMVKRAAL